MNNTFVTSHPKNNLDVTVEFDPKNVRLMNARYKDGENIEMTEAIRTQLQADLDSFVPRPQLKVVLNADNAIDTDNAFIFVLRFASISALSSNDFVPQAKQILLEELGVNLAFSIAPKDLKSLTMDFILGASTNGENPPQYLPREDKELYVAFGIVKTGGANSYLGLSVLAEKINTLAQRLNLCVEQPSLPVLYADAFTQKFVAFKVDDKGDVTLAHGESSTRGELYYFKQNKRDVETFALTVRKDADFRAQAALHAVARHLWSQFGDIPTDEDGTDGNIDAPFLHFPKETAVYDVWDWFESTFDIVIGADLM